MNIDSVGKDAFSGQNAAARDLRIRVILVAPRKQDSVGEFTLHGETPTQGVLLCGLLSAEHTSKVASQALQSWGCHSSGPGWGLGRVCSGSLCCL